MDQTQFNLLRVAQQEADKVFKTMKKITWSKKTCYINGFRDAITLIKTDLSDDIVDSLYAALKREGLIK